MTSAVSTGVGSFALATLSTSGPTFNASLIVSDFIRATPTRKSMHVQLPKGLSPGATSSLRKAIQGLFRLRQLESSWDGDSADVLTDDAFETAVGLLVALAIQAPPRAQLIPLTDGGVQLEWHVGGNDVEIEVDRIGEVHAFISVSDGSVVLNRGMPPSLIPGIVPVIKRYLMRMSNLIREPG